MAEKVVRESEVTITQTQYDLLNLKAEACDVMARIMLLDEQRNTLLVKKNEISTKIGLVYKKMQ